MNDRRLGLVIRTLRRRRGWRQVDLAAAAGVSQSLVSRAEASHVDTLTVRALRRICAALDIRLDLNARWRAGDLDRLLDSRHAGIAAEAAGVLVGDGWLALHEVTFAISGERGSIDLLGVREAERIAAAMEVKSEITSWEETQRRLDVKVRLASRIVYERFGWRPRIVACILGGEDTTTNRRRIAGAGPSVKLQFPATSREIRTWLGRPSGPLRGIWFLSSMRRGGDKCATRGFHRVRRPRTG